MVEKYTSDDFEKIFERIKTETSIRSIRQLAEIIGKKHPTILSAKAKNNFSASWAYSVGKQYGLLTEWIMTGEGPRRLSEASGINPLLVEVNEWLNEEEKQKDADFRTLFQQQMIRAFFDYEKWVKKKKRPLGSIPVNPKLKLA